MTDVRESRGTEENVVLTGLGGASRKVWEGVASQEALTDLRVLDRAAVTADEIIS